MTLELICAGFGGQGVLTMGMMLVQAGMKKGLNVLFYPSYGSEMRGGTANCSVKISDKRIPSPVCKQPDVLIAMNSPALDKFEPRMKSGGLILVNSSIVPDERPFRSDLRIVRVPAQSIAQAHDNPTGQNIVILGAFAAMTGLFSPDFLQQAIEGYFAAKGKVNPRNALCFRGGVEAAEAQKGSA